MLEAYKVAHGHTDENALKLIATFEERQKSRHKTQTCCGQSVGWFIERGQVLMEGDILECRDGTRIQVIAANEALSRVTAKTPLLLLKAAYHLGNRHVPLQITEAFVQYQRDHVLDAMVHGLGLTVTPVECGFQPESGAYGHGHTHAHD